MQMLEVTHLQKYFNKGTANEVQALIDCSMSIEDGEFVVIIGANGSGKSTLLNLVAGIFLPDKGKVSIDNQDVTLRKDFQRSKWIARVFQDPMVGTASELTIIDNFRLAALRTQRKTFRTGVNTLFINIVRDKLSLLNLGLENKLNTIVGRLSGGQRQALTLLMSVMDNPKILLLDEPTAALDPKSSELIIKLSDDLIRQYNTTTLLVTHNIQYASRYGTRIILMHQGNITRDLSGEQKAKLQPDDLYHWFYQ